MKNRRFAGILIARAAIVLIASGMLASLAFAQADYPNKPIKILVPFPPGGTSDVMGRMMAEPLSRILKQPVTVENVGGGGGVVGTERGVRAAADGYTIIQTGVGQNAVAHGLDADLIKRYNSNTDFIHLSQIHHGPNVLVVNADRPFKSLKDVVQFAKANPGKLDYGYTHASSGHMAMEQFKQTAGIFITGIPYRGGGPMLTAAISNEIPFMFINQDVAFPHVKSGKLRALAVSSLQRNPLFPDVPTVAESGYPGFQALSWSGLSIQKGTPQPIVEKLEAAIKEVMTSPAIVQRMASQGFVIPPLGQKPYADFVAKEIVQWERVIKTAGIKAQ
ncbi:MAG: tripartite tricarboxylate transporter substrate binding protein [Burkholderiales bacterium]|nr:MAG: tripartite tricarboxylate transporter substrate binding protein [Burkholderiales bacterium]